MLIAEIGPQILTFWFGKPSSPDHGKYRQFWFQSSLQLDQTIREQFETTYQKAIKGELALLQQTPEGSLSLVILLDQFPRNMYRGTPKAFSSDAQAIEIAKNAIENGFDKKLIPLQRLFLYLPFEHSENLKDQEKSVELFKNLGETEALDYAVQHHDIIFRFGRFPHRNAILGRKSTPDEIHFLEKSGGSNFGQKIK